jgi:hypothetical protein
LFRVRFIIAIDNLNRLKSILTSYTSNSCSEIKSHHEDLKKLNLSDTSLVFTCVRDGLNDLIAKVPVLFTNEFVIEDNCSIILDCFNSAELELTLFDSNESLIEDISITNINFNVTCSEFSWISLEVSPLTPGITFLQIQIFIFFLCLVLVWKTKTITHFILFAYKIIQMYQMRSYMPINKPVSKRSINVVFVPLQPISVSTHPTMKSSIEDEVMMRDAQIQGYKRNPINLLSLLDAEMGERTPMKVGSPLSNIKRGNTSVQIQTPIEARERNSFQRLPISPIPFPSYMNEGRDFAESTHSSKMISEEEFELILKEEMDVISQLEEFNKL